MSLKPAQGDAANGKDTRRPTAKSPLRTPTPATPPDGGWGWMIVVSSFMVSVLVDGVCFSAGIFFNPFRSYFGTTKAQTAWVGSVLNGSYLTIGTFLLSLSLSVCLSVSLSLSLKQNKMAADLRKCG